jgi:phage shock protein A
MTNIFKRLNDIISANINDLIDRVEDPERMIKQIIREMEENIARAKDGVIDAIASEKQLFKDLDSQRRQSAEWLKKAEGALEAGQEDMARVALTRKKEHDNIIKALEPSWESAKATSERLKTQLHAIEAKLEEAKRKRSTLVARQRAVQAREAMDDTLSHFQAGIDAHANFGRMEDKVAAMEARVEAMDELRSDSSRVEKDFLAMETEREVDNELAALKKKVGKE